MGEPAAEVPPFAREELLEALHEAVGGPVPALIWAAAHMCDIEKLEVMLRVARIDPAYLHGIAVLELPLYCNMFS